MTECYKVKRIPKWMGGMHSKDLGMKIGTIVIPKKPIDIGRNVGHFDKVDVYNFKTGKEGTVWAFQLEWTACKK